MRKFLIFLAIGIAPFVMRADPLNPYSFSATTVTNAQVNDDEARVRGLAKLFVLRTTTTNAFYIKLSAITGTVASISGEQVIMSGTYTNASTGMSFILTNNILYNDTVRMSVSNAANGVYTNSFSGVLIQSM